MSRLAHALFQQGRRIKGRLSPLLALQVFVFKLVDLLDVRVGGLAVENMLWV
jgi:hypothetical protein